MGRMILILCLVCSCRSLPKADEESENEVEVTEVTEGTLPAQDEPVTPAKAVSLGEPDARDLNRLRLWLAAQDTGFDLERLEDCEAQLLVRGDQVQSKADIVKAADALQADVRESLPLYHWCYYHMLTRLEYQLEQQNLGRSWQDKLQQFLRESKALFIVAECLDRSRQSRSYRANLQKKYIQLSQAWFGRNLSPTEASGKKATKKPAAPYDDEESQ